MQTTLQTHIPISAFLKWLKFAPPICIKRWGVGGLAIVISYILCLYILYENNLFLFARINKVFYLQYPHQNPQSRFSLL